MSDAKLVRVEQPYCHVMKYSEDFLMSTGFVESNVGRLPPGSLYSTVPKASGCIWQLSHVRTLKLVSGGCRMGWDPMS